MVRSHNQPIDGRVLSAGPIRPQHPMQYHGKGIPLGVWSAGLALLAALSLLLPEWSWARLLWLGLLALAFVPLAIRKARISWLRWDIMHNFVELTKAENWAAKQAQNRLALRSLFTLNLFRVVFGVVRDEKDVRRRIPARNYVWLGFKETFAPKLYPNHNDLARFAIKFTRITEVLHGTVLERMWLSAAYVLGVIETDDVMAVLHNEAPSIKNLVHGRVGMDIDHRGDKPMRYWVTFYRLSGDGSVQVPGRLDAATEHARRGREANGAAPEDDGYTVTEDAEWP